MATPTGHVKLVERKRGDVFYLRRHTFGTLAVRVFPLSDVMAYIGHANIQTTMRYAHHVPKVDAAKRFSEAIEQAMGKPSSEPSSELPRTERT